MSSIGKDKLDYLIGIASIDCGDDDVKMFDELDVSHVVFSKRFYRIKARRIKAHKRGLSAVRRMASVAAMVAVAVLVTGLITVSSIPTLRNKVLGSIIDWCENYLTITYDVDGQESESIKETEAETIPQETDAETEKEAIKIDVVKKPTFIEQGVEEQVVLQNNTQTVIDYYADGEFLFTYVQMLLNDKNLYIDSIEADVKIVEINGVEGKLIEFKTEESRLLAWNDTEYAYQIVSKRCTGDYLIQVAESVE